MSLFETYLADKYAQEGLEDIQEQQLDTLGFGELYGAEAAEMAKFKPYTVTSSLGGAKTTVDPDTGQLKVDITKTQAEKDLETDLLSSATSLFELAGKDPSIAQADLYEQMRAVQRPEEERQRLALEERMLAQGRLGLSSAAYGGANPELLAQEQARQEAMLKANLGARAQAMTELGQFGALGTQLLAGAYTPQTEALGLLGAGTNVAQLQDLGAREGAGLYSTMMQKAFDPYTTLLTKEYGKKAERDKAYYEAILDLF